MLAAKHPVNGSQRLRGVTMRIWAFMAAILCGLLSFDRPAGAVVSIHVDLSAQRIQVSNGAGQSYNWPVSSGRSGFGTPHGVYKPYSLQTMHYSRKYHMSPMPYSIFFHGGYAIHGTYSTAQLGRPASHGCVRLAPGNARALFSMVKQEGANITISGTPPGGRAYASRSHGRHKVQMARAHGHRHHATYAASRTRSVNPMAYAPAHQAPQLHRWFGNPAGYY
jgi:hypothetical protein